MTEMLVLEVVVVRTGCECVRGSCVVSSTDNVLEISVVADKYKYVHKH